MSLTRRRFIQTASLSVLASAACPVAFAQSGFEPKDDLFDPEHLTVFNGVSPQSFESLIGETFAVRDASRPLGSLMLLSVAAGAPVQAATKVPMVGRVPKPSQRPLTSFSLRFQGSGAALEQGTYTLEHETLGSFPLFIVPSGSGAEPPTSTAIFNLLGPPERL
jgi:hypothetical protein